MKISVIIPCYNAEPTIERQLNALAQQSWSDEWQVIICNNRSTDATIDIAKNYREKIQNFSIIEAFGKQGTAYAMNVGAKYASGEALLFCDADDMVGPTWLSAMGKALEKYDFVACKTDTRLLNAHLPKHHGYGNPQRTGLQYLWYPPYLCHAGCGTMGVKRALHLTVGGFDESIRHLFDTDYCIRVQINSNIKLHYVPEAILHIGYRDSIFGTFKQSFNYAEFNILLFSKYRDYCKNENKLWKKYFRDWKKLLKRLSTGSFYEDRFVLLWMLGRQIGRLKGSLSYSVPPV